MPTFSQIQNQFNSAKARNLIGQDESLADFAKKALEFTGDPSYKSVAEGGTIGNFVRGASADLTNFVNSGPVDEWLGAGTEWLGGKFGVDPEAARSVGESLPRMAVDYLPMAVGAALAVPTVGASLPIGMAATSGLSAANAYEQSGSLADAAIGGVAPYLGSKLSEIGGRAALNLVPKSQILQRLGFTGGTQVSGRALSAAEQAGLVTNRGLTESVAKATTKSFTELDKPLDKVLHYLGGEALANVGFTGLDIAQQGTDAVFNRNYLFANLVSNIPFAAADLAGSFGNRPIGEIKYDLPEAPPVYLSDGERRALLAASSFADLKSPEAVREYRQKYGLDMADIAIRTEELATALNRKELGLREAEDTFTTKWNNYVQNSPEAQQAGIKPVQQGGAFGKERLNIKELMGQEGLPIEAQKIVDEYRMKRTSLKKEVNGVIARLGKPVNTVDSLKLGVQQLNLDEFLQTPVEQRDYVKALEGTMLSLDGADLIRDVHRVQAGLEPVRGDLYQKYVDLFAGKDVELTPDKSMELLVAASLARGQTPKFTVAREKVKQAVEEGQTDDVVAKKAVEGVIEENKVSVQPFRQPVVPDDTLSGLTDLGQKSGADLTKGMINRPGIKQQFIPDQVESGLTQAGEVADVDLVKNLARKEVKPQVEQTVVEKLIASIPAKWPDETKNVVAEFYKTGDDTQLKNLGTDKDSELRKKIAYRSLREADPTYEQRLKDWEKAYNEKETQRQKVLNQIPVHEENIDSDVLEILNDNRVEQEMIPEEFFRAEDWSRVKDQDGNEHLIPLPEGEFQQVEQFALSLMSKLVSPEMLPESSKELVELAKLFNNPEVAYAELGKMVKGKGDVQFAREQDTEYLAAVQAGDMETVQRMVDEAAKADGVILNAPLVGKSPIISSTKNPAAKPFKFYQGFRYEPGKHPGFVYRKGAVKNLADRSIGFYLSGNLEHAEEYSKKILKDDERIGETRSLYVRSKNPFKFYVENLTGHQLIDVLERGGVKIPEDVKDRWKWVYTNGLSHESKVWKWINADHMNRGEAFNTSLKNAFVEAGYDSIMHPDSSGILWGLPEPVMAIAVFNPSQIKSADPVTYDEAGNVIPLSQRFNDHSPDIRFAQNQGRVYGAASYKAKQILLNSKALQGLRASDRAVFIFAHEQVHISFAKALEGKYGPQAKIQAEKALAWVNAADPQAKKNVEDVLKELHLDKELAQMDGIRDVLNNPDPQEWLANVMGMYGFGAVKSKAPKQAFAMLPKPVREFAEWMVRHLQNLSKGAMTWLKLSGKDYQGAKQTKELFDSIRRSYRQAEWEAAQAERFLDIEPTSMFDRGEEFAFAQGKMGEVGEQPFKDAPKRWIGGMWNKIVQPMHTLGNLYEGFRAPVMAVFNAHSDTENAIGDVFKVVVGELGADEKVRMTNEAFKKVMGSEQLNKLFNQIQVRSQVVKKRMIKLNDQNTNEVLDFEALSPELRGRLQQFNPEAQKALATMIAQAERANILHQEKILQAEWQGSVHDFATLLASKISFNKQDYGKAVEISKGVLNDLKMANETRSEFDQQRFMAQAQSKLAQLEESDQVSASVQAQEIFKRYDDLKKYYDDHPTWMSFRRYGKIKQRIEKNGEFDVIDADTEKELAETLKFYTEQGWKQVGKRQVVEKKLQGQYYLNDALLKIMQDREGQFKTMLQEANIPEEEKARLMAVPSATSAMISEINSRELYRPTKGRKLTGDLERFDWWEQFQRYTPAALAAAQRRALGAKINYWMQNPELDGLKMQKDQFMALYEQSKKPDPEWARKLNKLNAVWHIGWNLPGHIAEVFQPMLSGVHELVAKGESLPEAVKQFYRAEKDVGKVWGYRLKDKFFKPEDARVKINDEVFEGLPALWLRVHGESPENVDIARMLHAKRDRIQKAPLSEIRNFTGEQHAKLQDVISGNRQRTLGEIIASPFTMYANAAMNFYSKFTQHNGIVTMVTAYKKFKKQGMSHEQAMDAAELFDLTVNNSGGRLERPEMFGKLGGAGHLPYGLTSYVRGRFSQLATYYRHGFETEAFGNLTPAERGNAKKAFQTMILAQLGAAGILGIPFVGAGIALMEELLGEDLKGKMINALDEVTNDPTLTRVFTHGMMSTMAESFGLPADLHSRFALSSFLGTNSYDGMSAKSFMGPSVAMLDSMFNLGGQIAKGESMEKALTVAGPGGVKRLVEALGEEYQRENPESNLMMSMLGFRSSQQVKKKEWEQITRKQELETRRKLEQSAMAISKALETGSINGRKQLLIEADKLLPKDLDFQQTIKQRQQNIKDLIQKVSMIEADKVGPQDVRREISGRLAPMASQTAQSMGVQMSNPMELARALQQQKTRSQLGATVSQRPVRNAMLQEMQWGSNPWEF